MAIEQKIKAVLQSAELVFELAIIDPTRYGPIIHANVPDYAEILMKVFIEEAGRSITKKVRNKDKGLNFFELAQDINKNSKGINLVRFQEIIEYFISIREQFRNPLHHTDKVQGYVIAKPVALECLLIFDDLLSVLFPTLNSALFINSNYACYIQYIRLDYDQGFGKNVKHYSAVISALHRIEEEQDFYCPDGFDSSRVVAIKQLFKFDNDKYTRTVFNYRPQIKGLVVDELHRSQIPLSSNQLLPRLKNHPYNLDLTVDEIERCLGFIEGESIVGLGKITGTRSRTSTGNQIIRYSLVA